MELGHLPYRKRTFETLSGSGARATRQEALAQDVLDVSRHWQQPSSPTTSCSRGNAEKLNELRTTLSRGNDNAFVGASESGSYGTRRIL